MAARRIAMVAYTHYQTDPRCRREATLAAAGGWEVHFYALSRDGHSRTEAVEGITLHELPMERYRGGSTVSYLLGYLRFLFLAGGAVFAAHLRRRFRIIHVNTMPDFMVLTGLLPRMCGARLLLDIHDVMPEIYMTKFKVPATHWKIRLIKSSEVLAARLAHRVLTAEHPKLELLVAHGVPRGKLSVLLNLPDDAIFPLRRRTPEPMLLAAGGPPPTVEFRLIYHGTIVHRLGLDHAVNAMGLLAAEWPGLTLSLYGDGDQLPELHALATRSGIADRVWFSDRFLPIEEILPAIAAAHLAVLPTRHEISTDYMLPTKLLEYLACGVPALFTPTLTVRHYFGDSHPLYLEDPSPAALAERIVWVRANYAEVVRLTNELQDRFFGRWHWSEHKHTYLDLLDELDGVKRGACRR